MAEDPLEALKRAIDDFSNYPHNLLKLPGHHIQSTAEHQLSKRAPDLFCLDQEAKLYLLETDVDGTNPHVCPVQSRQALRELLRSSIDRNEFEPPLRIVFLRAPSSRHRLNISRDMFLILLSCHNVPPSFIKHVVSFGHQRESLQFHSMGFNSATRLLEHNRGLCIQQLGRSGRHIEISYTFKSVERGRKQGTDPATNWPIRQCSIYHWFDLETQQSTWIVLKANEVMQEAMQRYMEENAVTSNEYNIKSFARALELHKIVCEWAADNWHWYINELQTSLNEKTGGASSVPYEYVQSNTQNSDPDPLAFQTSSAAQRSFSFHELPKKMFSRTSTMTNSTKVLTLSRTNTLASTPELTQQITALNCFSFRHLQSAHYIEEKANEVLFVLEENFRVVNQLNLEYQQLLQCNNAMEHIMGDWKTTISDFDHAMSRIDQDLQMEISRIKSLLRLIEDRKSMLTAILEYKSMEASRMSTDRANAFAAKMQNLTADMHVIAQKTKVETISMRIITWVTLFFLPGTFISTLMSTPMVHFENQESSFSHKNIGWGAVRLYLAASLPLVTFTLAAWWLSNYRAKRSARSDEEKIAN